MIIISNIVWHVDPGFIYAAKTHQVHLICVWIGIFFCFWKDSKISIFTVQLELPNLRDGMSKNRGRSRSEESYSYEFLAVQLEANKCTACCFLTCCFLFFWGLVVIFRRFLFISQSHRALGARIFQIYLLDMGSSISPNISKMDHTCIHTARDTPRDRSRGSATSCGATRISFSVGKLL